MIFYRPTDGDPQTTPLRYRPRTCFLMTQLGGVVPPEIVEIRDAIGGVLRAGHYELIDANTVVTGRDFLLKIWELIVTVPLGVAVIHHAMRQNTVANIFYEMGVMQAYGKETLVVKTPQARVPSDFVRTEYVEYGGSFAESLERFMESLQKRAQYYTLVADQLDNNPLLAIDYLRRAYLITGDDTLREQAHEIFDNAGLENRARNSVEMLLIGF